MIPVSILHNLRPWAEQVIVIALAGAILPAIIRLQHPRTKLVYCHLMLAACLLLPVLQPWRHEVVVVSESSAESVDAPVAVAASPATGTPAQSAAPSSAPVPAVPTMPLPFWQRIPAEHIWLSILAVGALARLVWLLAGLGKIRGYRIASTPLYPVPRAVEAASALTAADALFCVSTEISGPVMLGVFCPVVLLPESFATMEEEAQCGIAAHELLHVRRNDWFVTVLEELAGSLLWFSPGVWWLLAQTRLAREQLVDAEAVRLTSARDAYLLALLAIARSRQALDTAPAPLFLRRRHLAQRMHFLLKDVSVSLPKLVASYALIGILLAAAGRFSFGAFPLAGSPRIERIAAAAAPAAPAPVPEPVQAAVSPSQARRVRPEVPPPPGNGQELVTGAIQVPVSPADRAAALSLLERARQNSDMHLAGTPPFRLDATFVAGGSVAYTGPGALSEVWFSGTQWRWTANLAEYSQARIGRGQTGFDEHPVASVPLRVHMLRGAVFWPVRFGPAVPLRVAQAQRNGKPLTCLLLNGEAASAATTRLWSEQEYCIDNASGRLDVFSPAPGTYFNYEYGRNDFHGRSIPDRITATVDGIPVLDAQITIADANASDQTVAAASYVPGITLAAGQRFLISTPDNSAAGSTQTVIVHAALSPAGSALEEEISLSADSRLNPLALDIVKQHTFPAAATQRDAYVSVGFVPVQ